jgi:hypothetical protein
MMRLGDVTIREGIEEGREWVGEKGGALSIPDLLTSGVYPVRPSKKLCDMVERQFGQVYDIMSEAK